MHSSFLVQKSGMLGKGIKHALYGLLTEYETPKIVLIRSFKFAFLLRLMQTIILLYSVLYLLIYEKGYQKQDTAIISSVTLKVKGIGYSKTPQNKTIIIDVADYIIPASENNAIFIMTNFIQTDQTRSKCGESTSLKEARCQNDADCRRKIYIPGINGQWTGRCLLPLDKQAVNTTENITTNVTGLCEMEGWCPAESDRTPSLLTGDVLNFTIFIKNFIEFPAFDIKHKNMVDNLKPCIFHRVRHPDCPIYRLDYLIKQAETNATERQLMLRLGGVIRVKLEWDCNLDRTIKLCKPKYSFARLDVPFRDRPFSFGFNFRFASIWKNEEETFRTLTKAYGLRLIIAVSGKAGKFHFITLSLNTGSLVGIFGLATFLCDIILLHLSNKSQIYRNHVFESVHSRTRFDSLFRTSKNSTRNRSGKCKNSDESRKISSLNQTPKSDINSAGKTAEIRPLTSIDPDQVAHSKLSS